MVTMVVRIGMKWTRVLMPGRLDAPEGYRKSGGYPILGPWIYGARPERRGDLGDAEGWSGLPRPGAAPRREGVAAGG